MDISISPELVLARERRRKQKGVFMFLALAVAVTTVVLLINPATTQEYEPTCGYEAHVHGPACFETVDRLICETEERPGHVHDASCYEVVQTCVCGLEGDETHEHTPECFVEERILICELPENEVHEHSADCVEWRDVLTCGFEDDPEHEHSPDCFKSVPVFVCEERPGVGHVHNEYCYLQEEVLTCMLPEHEHTDACFPKLTGDPHADVEIDFDWESTFCDVEKTGVWAEDLIAIASSQIGYAESARNFVTDEYNVRHGYTRYGDWYGNRYAGWNAIYVMFCLHYADVWGIPTDSVPANWMNSARAQGFWTEADGEPIRGDLVFFDDDADGFADRVAIVTEVREDEIDVLLGGTGVTVGTETFPRYADRIAGYLALPQNPDYVTLETAEPEAASDTTDGPVPAEPAAVWIDPVTLSTDTEDGIRATLNADAGVIPYPPEELTLLIREADVSETGAGAETLAGQLEGEGVKSTGIRWLDISVWRTETVCVVPPGEETPEPAEPASADDPGEPEQEFCGEPDDPSGTDEIPEPEAPASADPAEDVSAEAPGTAPTETRLVEVIPYGPVEITVEGLSEDGSILVYRVSQYGEAEKLESHTGETRGCVTLTTGLN